MGRLLSNVRDRQEWVTRFHEIPDPPAEGRPWIRVNSIKGIFAIKKDFNYREIIISNLNSECDQMPDNSWELV